MDRSAADMLSEFYMKFFRRIAMKRVHRMQRVSVLSSGLEQG
ncbi:hypothetical protein [Rhizobium laguerreae]|nr:hypothetical protein [Rhizobium laguerreae]